MKLHGTSIIGSTEHITIDKENASNLELVLKNNVLPLNYEFSWIKQMFYSHKLNIQ